MEKKLIFTHELKIQIIKIINLQFLNISVNTEPTLNIISLNNNIPKMMKIILEYLSREDNIEKLDDLFSYTKINFSKLGLIKNLRQKITLYYLRKVAKSNLIENEEKSLINGQMNAKDKFKDLKIN